MCLVKYDGYFDIYSFEKPVLWLLPHLLTGYVTRFGQSQSYTACSHDTF